MIIVTPPLQITAVAVNSQPLQWDSAPGLNYQVLATTNLAQPFQTVGTPIPSQGATTSYFDNDTNQNSQKFFDIEMVP